MSYYQSEEYKQDLLRRKREAALRSYYRNKKGQDIPLKKQGRPEYIMTEEHRNNIKGKNLREANGNWKGDNVTASGARARARYWYKEQQPCSYCGAENTIRHHINENILDNTATNIEFMCRACHTRHHNYGRNK